MGLKGFFTSPVTQIAPLTFGLLMLFQNCAPPTALHKPDLANSDGFEVPMSQVQVRLDHGTMGTLSDVDLYADDAVSALKSSDPISKSTRADSTSTTALAIRLAAPQESAGATFNLELPLGSQKLIVARAKLHDPMSNQISTYYGNAFVHSNDSTSEVTIKMVAHPNSQ